jgi:hypothetical protein
LSAFLTRSHTVSFCAGDVLRAFSPLFGAKQTLSRQECKKKKTQNYVYMLFIINSLTTERVAFMNPITALLGCGGTASCRDPPIIPEITIDTI